MPIISDYHMHPLAHDPHRVYTDELMEEWIQAAAGKGISDLTFTDHDRFHKGVNFDVFFRAQEKAAEQGIILNIGIELDNDPESSAEGRKWTEKNYDRLNYILGSIHFLQDWPFDHPDYMAEFEKRDVAAAWEEYFREIERIGSDGLFDAYGHLDLIKIFKYFPDRDVMPAIESALASIKKNDKAIELNTAGWHKPVKEQYPSLAILKKAASMGIPVTVSSDAHASSHIGRSYTEALGILSEAGISEIAVWRNHKRQMIPIL